MKTDISPTWILFASGNSVKIELSLYDPAADRNRPITAYIVNDVGSDVADSASRAAETIFNIAHTHKLAPPPTVAGFDLPGLAGGSRIAGQSSGLALALALAKKLWPENDPGPIAATGEIASSGNGGRIRKISQFAAKARAAAQLLKNGGCFFYPAGNEAEMIPELKSELADKGIKLCPTASVNEALIIAFPKIFGSAATTTSVPDNPPTELAASTIIPEEKPCRNLKFLLTTTVLIMLILAGSLYMAGKNPRAIPAKTPKTPAIPTTVNPATENSTPVNPATGNPAAEAVNKPESQNIKPKTAPSPPEPLDIAITGNSSLSKILARRSNSRLQALIDSERQDFRKLKSVKGRIKILSIKEQWSAADNALKLSISATISGRVSLKDAVSYNFTLEPVSSYGPEPIAQQLTKVATRLVEKIAVVLQNPPSEANSTIKSNQPATAPAVNRSHQEKQNNPGDQPGRGFE